MTQPNHKKIYAIIGIGVISLAIGFFVFKTIKVSQIQKDGTEREKTTLEIMWLDIIAEKKYVWKYVWTGSVENKKVFWDVTAREAVQEKKSADEVKPFVIAICRNFTKVYDIVRSPSFQLIKERVDKIKGTLKNKDNFLYVVLPELVHTSCPKNDKFFKDGIIRYLQNDHSDIILADEESLKKYVGYIDKIDFTAPTDTPISKIKTDKTYFKEVLFEKNLKWMEQVYFSEYTFLKDKSDTDFFRHFSILSLEERNEILERTIWKLVIFLKKVGIGSMDEFRELILKNYRYGANVNDLKAHLIKKYKLFDEKLKRKGINLTLELVDIASLSKFYTSEKFKLVRNDPELYGLFKEIGLWHLHYSIISDKFADSMNEWWSGKEQFGDSIVWNGIIRLGYLYLREAGKDIDTK